VVRAAGPRRVRTLTVAAPVERIPLWVRAGSIIVSYPAPYVAAGPANAPESERPLDRDPVGGSRRSGSASARLPGGGRIGWRRGEWELPPDRDVDDGDPLSLDHRDWAETPADPGSVLIVPDPCRGVGSMRSPACTFRGG